MNLNIQITSLIISFIFGILFSIFLKANYKILYSKYKIIKYIGSLLIIIISELLYFITMQKINNSAFHPYLLLAIISGFVLENKVYNTFVKKHKKWYTKPIKVGDKMAKKKVPKKAKRRLILLGPIAIFIIGYSIFTLITTSINLYELHKEEIELNEKLTNLKADAKSLKNEITKLQDKEYIARYARENYLYTKNGEYVIKLDDEGKKITKVKANYNEDYLIYGCACTLIIIFLFIFIKHRKRK